MNIIYVAYGHYSFAHLKQLETWLKSFSSLCEMWLKDSREVCKWHINCGLVKTDVMRQMQHRWKSIRDVSSVCASQGRICGNILLSCRSFQTFSNSQILYCEEPPSWNKGIYTERMNDIIKTMCAWWFGFHLSLYQGNHLQTKIFVHIFIDNVSVVLLNIRYC